ncbi:MAG: ArnT family glycosyltransferase, partial [Bacteroidota bacterium]
MLSLLPDQSRERFYLSVLTLASLLRFINLGFKDLQAWDEALYAVRAEGIVRYSGWMDQTPFAIDGLYSSLHPPLYVWLTTIAFYLLGVNEFAARFFSALLGGCTLFVIFWTGKKLVNADVGFLAAMLFGLNPFVTFFSRQGQFDAALVFFLSLAIFFLLDTNRIYDKRNTILAGISLGLALMTKLYVGLGVPLAYACWVLMNPEKKEITRWKLFLQLLAIASLVAVPWHAYMTVVHGGGDPFFFVKASALWERTISGIEGNIKPLEAFYFVNQLFVLFPVGVLWFGYGLWNILRQREQSWLLLASWFVVFFLVVSIVRTKLAVYLLPMLVPASLIAAREIWNAITNSMSSKRFTLLVGGTLLSVLWSSSQGWRNATKEIISSLTSFRLPPADSFMSFLPLFLLSLFLAAISFALFRLGWVEYLRRPLIGLIIIPLLIWSVYQITSLETFQYR